MKLTKNQLIKLIKYAVVIVVFSIIIFSVEQRGHLRSLDNRSVFDLFHVRQGLKKTPENVAVVEIDNATFEALKNVPMLFWGPEYAKVIAKLRAAGVRAIGIDTVFTISIERWFGEYFGDDFEKESRRYDLSFRQELAKGNVTLISTFSDKEGKAKMVMPILEYIYSLPNTMNDLSLANLIYDKDGIIRHYSYAFFESDNPPYLSLAAKLVEMQTGEPMLSDAPKDLRSIFYYGPPGTVPTVSFSRLLSSDALSDPDVKALSGKVVIISLSKDSNEDLHLTPYSKGSNIRGSDKVKGTVMTGGEVHANIIESMLTGDSMNRMSTPGTLIYLLIFSLISAVIFFKLGNVWGAVNIFTLSVAHIFISYIFFTNRIFVPVAATLLIIFLNYLLSLGLRYTAEEREKKLYHSVFERYVSGEVVRQMLESGDVPALGGEMKEITVLFSDIRNFTTISEILQPFEVVEMLNKYFSVICEKILDAGGTIDKFIGDAIMVTFGSTLHYENHAEMALATALIMDENAKEFQKWMKGRFGTRYEDVPEFNIGIGIHSGDAIVGNIGSLKKREFTAIGDTVNLASRLEGFTKVFDANIIVSKDLIGKIDRELITGKSEFVKVKGKVKEVEVVEFLGFKE